MHRRFLLPLVLALLLAACGADERQVDACRQILATVVGEKARVTETQFDGAGTLKLAYRDGERSGRLACRFDGPPLSRRHLDLMAVEHDWTALSGIQLVFLRHLLGLPVPAALIAPPEPPPPLAQRAAYLVQQIINGLAIGAVLALIATGYSLVYGITGTIQFAYGELFMIGAYMLVIPFFVLGGIGFHRLGLTFALALPVAAAATAGYGWVIARLIYRPLLEAGRLNALIAAIGLAMALREFVRLAQGGGYKWLPELLRSRFVLFEGGGFSVYLSSTQIVTLALAVVLAAALAWLLLRTPWGRAHRACADDPLTAALLGVDIHGTIARTFALGAALAALAGAVVTLQYGEADPYMGYIVGFKALTAALLGGFGTVSGALLGGLLIGLFEALWAGYFGSLYTDAMVFALLVLILVFRPDGMLGSAKA
ncbi:MAG: branched-chain amino acid ABC transporter permease LivH [Alphaproteobacteria bacterium]|nr:branched-chain amino acid ABC transporter permease LivH [Alphaproteobacteria bacterium]